ncbi:MAG: hypothetical protein JOZ39_02955 [Chloroflexi bacterium]|nr:hypothetical protein [Chloroflexota bacterium]
MISFDAQDYSFAGPATIPGGLVTLQLRNTGKEVHHLQLLKLNTNATPEQALGALASANPESVFQFVTATGGVGSIDPTGTAQITANLQPGQYVLACFIPSPSDGIPHAAKGMVKPLTVTAPPAGQPAASPQSAGTVTLKDFSFDGPTTLNAGQVTLQVTNSGRQIHEMSVLKLASGKQPQDVLSFFQSTQRVPSSVSASVSVSSNSASLSVSAGSPSPSASAASGSAAARPAGGPPPFADAGGVNGLSQGLSAWGTLSLTPGDYVFICNVPDPQSGKPHWALGMIKGFSVK